MDIVFKRTLQTPFQLTTHIDEYRNSKQPKLAYTKMNDGFDCFIQSNELLFENEIKNALPIADKTYNDFPKFFKSETADLLSYDLFAMVFYFASRYEEYLPSEKDEHLRFKAETSLSYQYGCLQFPFLNLAIQQFGQKLKTRFPELNFKRRTFNYLSTIDIDNAFAYAHKGFARNAGGLVKDFFSLQFPNIIKRISSNLNEEKDPYNTFERIHALSKESQTALQYFVLIGDYSVYDKNPDPNNAGFRKLLKTLKHYSIGLHPSYEAFSHPEKIGIEKKRLEDIIEKKVTSARCHFLRVRLPETYRTFIENGITDDYSMIYASQSGFRTGLCIPFPWFDLRANKQTTLTIHPSTIMEGTLRDYNNYSPEKAVEVINHLLDQTKQFGGEFVSIWHNDSFVPDQKKWVEVYKSLLQSTNNS